MPSDQEVSDRPQPITAGHRPGGVGPRGGRQAALREFLGKLLAFQCQITGADAGAVYLRPGKGRAGGIFVAYHEESGATFDESTTRKLAVIGERAASGAPSGLSEPITLTGAQDLYAAKATHNALAVPLLADGRAEGSCIVLVSAGDRETGAIKLERLALTVSRFESFLWQQSFVSEAEQKVMLRETLELLDRAQRGSSAKAMGSLLCDEMRRRFGCTRVSIGMIRGDQLRVLSISGADDLDRHAPTVEAIESAMEETALQDSEVLYPPSDALEHEPGSRRVTHQHARLSESYGPSSIVSLPLRIDDDLVGVLVLERDASDPFPDAVLPLLRLVAEFIGPAVFTRRLADRRTPEVVRDDLRDLGAGIVGPRHTTKKILALLAILVFVVMAALPIPARVKGTMEVRAEVGRAIVPPFAGFLKSFEAKPGDPVQEGQIVATLETRELLLSRGEQAERWASLATQRDNAMARGELAEARQFAAQMQEAQAGIDLIDQRVALSELRSPIEGVISRGDLEKLVGAPVDASKALFEVVGPGVRVMIDIDERDAGRVRVGQKGWVSSRARPGQELAITVDRVNPVAQPREGANVFVIEATLDDVPDWVRPGMTGSARLSDGWSTPLWELSRPLVDAFRMWAWL